MDAQTPLWISGHHTYPSIPATLIEDFLLAHHILGTNGFDMSTEEGISLEKSSEGHSKQTGLGAQMSRESFTPAVLHAQFLPGVTLTQNSSMALHCTLDLVQTPQPSI